MNMAKVPPFPHGGKLNALWNLTTGLKDNSFATSLSLKQLIF